MANKLKYSEEVHSRIVAAIKDGATQRAAARMVGVTPETLSIWKRRYPDFREAVERAHAEAQVFAETSLYRMAAKGNVNALMFWLKNRHPSEWRELQHREITRKVTFEDFVAGLTESEQANRVGNTN
jgi:transposase-like protein